MILRGIVGWLFDVLAPSGSNRRCQDLFNDHSQAFIRIRIRIRIREQVHFLTLSKAAGLGKKINRTRGSAALQRISVNVYPTPTHVYPLVRSRNWAL